LPLAQSSENIRECFKDFNNIIYSWCKLYIQNINLFANKDTKSNNKNQNGISNLINIQADISQEIPGIVNQSVDVILMVNVFHGFKASGEMDKVIDNLKKVLKSEGRIAIMEFKPIEMSFGPPIDIRLSHVEMEELFEEHGFKKKYLNVDFGADAPEGKSHYLIIFEKE
jgi:SAM-dependent methyltransferase